MPANQTFNVCPRTAKGRNIFELPEYPDYKIVEMSVDNDAVPLKDNWAERWVTLPNTYEAVVDEVLDYDVREDDVFVTTFMKCGTTWMQETVWLLTHNLDFETAKRVNVSDRSPNLDGSGGVPRTPSTMELVAALPSPRVIKSHLPPHFLPKQIWSKKAKVVYVARNVKDCVVSNYKFLKSLMANSITIEEIAQEFMDNGIIYTPYLDRVVDWWKMRDLPNVFFITYEDMKRDLAGSLQRLCHFLERPELNEDELRQMVEHLSFDKMKNNKQAHIQDYCKNINMTTPSEDFRFMRRGIIGSYKDELPEKLQEELDTWTSNVLSKYGLAEEDIFGKV